MEKKSYKTPESQVIELDSEFLMVGATSLEQGEAGVGGSGNGDGLSSRSRLGGWDD